MIGIFLCLCIMVAIVFANQEIPLPPKDGQLAIIYFDTDSQLKEADKYGVYFLHYLPDRMIALITSDQKTWLEENKFIIQILDPHPTLEQTYYLVQLFIPLEKKQLTQQQSNFVTLSQFGTVNEYIPGTYLLRTDRTELTKLKELGYEYMVLSGRAYLPWVTPPERKRLTTSEHQVIQSLVNQVSWSNLSTHILFLQDNAANVGWDALGSRYTLNTTQWFPKTYYILTTFQSYGLTADYDYFTYSGYTDLRNIVAIQNGTDTSGYYIICAHCDSISSQAGSARINWQSCLCNYCLLCWR
jgi:hypothetical protein